MGRTPCCSKEGLNRGAWTAHEDQTLIDYIKTNGEGKWRNIPKKSGLKRCGKSCRLRWLNYLRPDIKRGNITLEEEDLIIRLHNLLGNRWSLIAGRLPGRTDNEIKNYWNTTLGKKAKGEQAKNSKHEKKKTGIKLSVNTPTLTEEEGDINLAPHQDKVENLETSAAAETSMDEDLANNVAITTSEEENSQNFEMDFNVGDLLLSDLPDSDFWKLCQFDVMEEGGNSGGEKNKWLSSGQPRFFSEEMMKDWMRDDCFHYKN